METPWRRKDERPAALDALFDKVGRAAKEVRLTQDTEDTAQLDPVARLAAIETAWKAVEPRLGNVTTVIDAGAGFGYGTVFLSALGKKVAGIEKSPKKVRQAFKLYTKAGVPFITEEEVLMGDAPTLVEGDFRTLRIPSVDLISMFYVSGAMIEDPRIFAKARKILGTKGTLLMTTERSPKEARAWLAAHPIPDADIEILEIPKNHDRTVVLIKFK